MDQTLKSFLDMAKELEEVTNTQNIEERSGLTFDPKQYRAKKEVLHFRWYDMLGYTNIM